MMRTVLLLLAFCSSQALYAENWISSGDEEIDAWYAMVQRGHFNEAEQRWTGGGRCCGKSDAYFADKAEAIDGKWVVTITDDREVPNRIARNGQTFTVNPDIIDRLRQGNPTGHVIIFVLPNGDMPYCFFPGDGV